MGGVYGEKPNAAPRAMLDQPAFRRFCVACPRLSLILSLMVNAGLVVLIFLAVIQLINAQGPYFLRSVGEKATATISEAGTVAGANGKLKTTVGYTFKTSDGGEVWGVGARQSG